jgi:hypothetical protein
MKHKWVEKTRSWSFIGTYATKLLVLRNIKNPLYSQ